MLDTNWLTFVCLLFANPLAWVAALLWFASLCYISLFG